MPLIWKISCGLLASLLVWHMPGPGIWAGEPAARQRTQTILFLGDSLTAGYGLDLQEAYPALIQSKIEKAGLPYRAVNGGLSGDTSAGGLRRINWLLRQRVDVLVLALGANDGLRGVDTKSTKQNLQAIIERVRTKNPEVKILIAGMQMPPNLGEEYTKAFREIYPSLAKENNISLIPFLLAGVAADPDLNQADGIHPNTRGHEIVAETVWAHLEDLLVEEEIEE